MRATIPPTPPGGQYRFAWKFFDWRAGGSRRIVEEIEWELCERRPRGNSHDLVGVRVEYDETALRHSVKTAGGIWRPRQRLRELSWEAVRILGLGSRVVDPSRPR